MQTESTIKPPIQLRFIIEETGNGKCNIHFYENIEQTTNKGGDTVYTYDLYILKDMRYHANLKNNIKANKAKWLAMAIAAENAAPEYSESQRLEQEITDLQIENIEQGQQITDLEIMVLEG